MRFSAVHTSDVAQAFADSQVTATHPAGEILSSHSSPTGHFFPDVAEKDGLVEGFFSAAWREQTGKRSRKAGTWGEIVYVGIP